MATLQDKLDTIRRTFEAKAPAEALAIMHGATDELVRSELHLAALGEGAQAPSFELPNTRGEVITSAALLERGPLVVTVFRGHW